MRMNNLYLFEDDVLKLFNIIVERNKLARVRSCKRGKLHREKKNFGKKTNRKNLDYNEAYKNITKAYGEYIDSCRTLAAFTLANKKLRHEIGKKYKAKQRNDASNLVSMIELQPLGSKDRVPFYREEIESISLNNEINDIILGVN